MHQRNLRFAAAVMLANVAVTVAVARSSLPSMFAAIAAVELVVPALAALPVAGPRPGAFAEYRLPVVQSEAPELGVSRRRASLTLAACSFLTLLLVLPAAVVD